MYFIKIETMVITRLDRHYCINCLPSESESVCSLLWSRLENGDDDDDDVDGDMRHEKLFTSPLSEYSCLMHDKSKLGSCSVSIAREWLIPWLLVDLLSRMKHDSNPVSSSDD